MRAYDITGVWKSSYFLADIVGQVRQRKNAISGYVEVRQPFSKVDIYHFEGSVNGDKVKAAHHKGSTFEGRIVSADAIVGVVTTVKGSKLHLSAKRVSQCPTLK